MDEQTSFLSPEHPEADSHALGHSVGSSASTPPDPGTALAAPGGDDESAGGRGSAEWIRLRSRALRQLDRFIRFEPKVLRGESAKGIHDLRVLSRRLQVTLDLLYPTPRPRPIEKLRRKLIRSRRALSKVRNCDALLEKVSAALARKRTARRDAWEALQGCLAEERQSASAKALRKLSKLNLGAVYVQLRERLLRENGAEGGPAAPPETPSQVIAFPHTPGARRFRRSLAREVERDWQDFAARHAESAASRGGDAGTIHRARIATKRLRYLVEVAHYLDVAGSREALGWLRRLQVSLGNWHDLEMLERAMLAMVARRRFLRQQLGTAIEIERLVARLRASKGRMAERRVRMTFGSGPRDSSGPSSEYRRLERWVAGWLAELAA